LLSDISDVRSSSVEIQESANRSSIS
jgi:hypothetical protein